MTHALYSSLCGIVGRKYVSDSEFAVWAYSKDSSSFTPRTPGIVVRPGTTDEVSQIVKLANQTKVSIIPRGGGCSYGGWPPGDHGQTICVDLTRMTKILDVNEINKTVTVEAGITWTELETRMRAKGLLVHTVYPADSVTVGGSVSGESNSGGGLESSGLGPNWTFIVGVKAVLPNGDVIETGTGANRLSKMYCRASHGPDITGFFIGSMGIFGIITEVTMQTSTLRPYSLETSFNFDNDRLDDAHKVMASLASLEPKICDSIVIFGPGPVSPKLRKWIVMIHISGFTEEEMNQKMEVITRTAYETSPATQGPTATSDMISKVHAARLHDTSHVEGMWFFIEIMCPRDESLRAFKETYEMCREDLKGWEDRVRLYTSSFFILGDVDYYSHIGHFAKHDIEARDKALSLWKSVVDKSMGMGMNLVILNKDLGDVCARYYTPEYHSFLRTLKLALDPNNIMNPHMLLLP